MATTWGKPVCRDASTGQNVRHCARAVVINGSSNDGAVDLDLVQWKLTGWLSGARPVPKSPPWIRVSAFLCSPKAWRVPSTSPEVEKA